MKNHFTKLLTVLLMCSCYNSFAQWKEVKQLQGGYVYSSATDSNTIYAKVADLGLFKSTNQGSLWDSVPLPFPNSISYNYISLDDGKLGLSTPGGSIAISLDSGNTFQLINPPYCNSTSVLYKGNVVSIQTTGWNSIIRCSGDNGITWSNDTINSGVCRLVKADDKLFAISYKTWGEVYTTLDSGKSWIFLGISTANLFQSFAAKGDSLVIISEHNQLLVSPDFGADWINIANHPSVISSNNGVVHFVNDTLFFVCNDSIFFSMDLGSSWQYVLYEPGLKCTGIIKTKNRILFASASYAIEQLDLNLNKMISRSNGINGVIIHSIFIKGDSVFVTCHYSNAIFYSYNNGNSWYHSTSRYMYSSSYLTGDNNNIFCNDYHLVFRSTDWAKTWQIIDTVPTLNKGAIFHDSIFYPTSYGVYAGPLQGPITHYGNLGKNVYDLEILDSTLIAVTKDHIWKSDLTTNQVWKHADNGLPIPMHFSKVGASDTAFFISGPSGIYRCYPPSYNWSFTGDTSSQDIVCSKNVAFTPKKGVAVLGDYPGSFWHSLSKGLTNKTVDVIAVNDSFIFAGGNYYHPGLWKHSLAKFIVISGENEFQKAQNTFVYPNPTSEYVNFSLPMDFKTEGDLLEVNISNFKGQNLIHNYITGNQSIDVSNIPNGIYIAELRSKTKVVRGKVIVQH